MEDLLLLSNLQERLARQIQLKELGKVGEEKILKAKFFVVGAGGLGSPALLYLAASGASHITVADPDEVSITNLSRQILHSENSIGINKAINCQHSLPIYNPTIEVIAIPKYLKDTEEFRNIIKNSDVVLDCSDNLETRHTINRMCHSLKKPLVFGSAVQFSGQITVFDFSSNQSSCYHCLFDEDNATNDIKASSLGVFSPLTGVVGTIQAAEALKLVAGIGSPLTNRLLMIDLLNMKFEEIKYKKRRHCPVCGDDY